MGYFEWQGGERTSYCRVLCWCSLSDKYVLDQLVWHNEIPSGGRGVFLALTLPGYEKSQSNMKFAINVFKEMLNKKRSVL